MRGLLAVFPAGVIWLASGLCADAQQSNYVSPGEHSFLAGEDHAVTPSPKTASFPFDATMRTVYGNTSGGAFAGTLVACTTATSGREYDFQKIGTDTNALTVTPAGTDILGTANASMSTVIPGDGWNLKCVGATATWQVRRYYSGAYAKLAAAPTNAPGAGQVLLYAIAGTNAGTCKLQMLAGTSTTPFTIADNVGAGC